MSPVFDPDAIASSDDEDEHDVEWLPAFWINGCPWRFIPYWDGRGLHLEIGTRAYLALDNLIEMGV